MTAGTTHDEGGGPMRWLVRKRFVFVIVALAVVFAAGAAGAYEYDGDGRDIFTYRTPTVSPPTPPIPGDDFREAPPPPPPPAEAEHLKARAAFLGGQYADAVKRCRKALDRLSRAGADDQEVARELSRLLKASEELKRRSDAAAEFEKLAIAIESIVLRNHSSAAVINGQVLKEGQAVAGLDVCVTEVERGRVVFLYKGYKFRKQMIKKTQEKQ